MMMEPMSHDTFDEPLSWSNADHDIVADVFYPDEDGPFLPAKRARMARESGNLATPRIVIRMSRGKPVIAILPRQRGKSN